MKKENNKEKNNIPVAAVESVKDREITDELRESFLDYAMSVIVDRALPDVRDGLKPVQRRILWAMWDTGLTSASKTRKSATVVGEVLGKYHPHGDVAVYDTMVRLAQDFSVRYPLIIGQGNFGSIDGDGAAAMRYTEAKMSKIAEELLLDIEKKTVDFMPNYDGTHNEPMVLPSKAPNLLLNGAVGIAVGMATNIPPHNLSEVLDASVHLIDNPDASTTDLMNFVKGPDFPTGGIIYDKNAIVEAYSSGKGKVTMRGVAEVDDKQIVITEIPYQVNKAELIIKMASLVQEKRIEGIKDIKDESDRNIRIVIDLKNDAVPQKILNQLYNLTDLQKDFHLNMLALAKGLRPTIMSLKDILAAHIEHRREVVRRRAEFDLQKAKDRAHILEGLSKAIDIIDEVIATVKKSKDKADVKVNLVKKFGFTELQAEAIAEMKLYTLSSLEKGKINEELAEKRKLIKELETLLKNDKAMLALIKEEFSEMKEKYGDDRRTRVVASGLKEFREEDLIPEEESLVTLSLGGYIKRQPSQSIKSQRRGGKGVIGSEVGEEDTLTHFVSANTHDNILFFTGGGKVFQTKGYDIPAASRTSKGKAIHNFLDISSNETISAIVAYSTEKKGLSGYLVMATASGVVKKTSLKEFANVRRNGIIAVNLKAGDKLIGAGLSSGKDEIMLSTRKGLAIRFKESDVRSMSRAAAGVRGINLRSGDVVSSFDIVPAEKAKSVNFLSIMSHGYAKATDLKEYKVQSRGGKGIITASITPKTGELVTSKVISDEEDLITISVKGQILRTDIASVRKTARAAQGVRIINLPSGDKVAGVTCL
ncbi:MAG: DNA gyrase subunit A [Candidatus Colwellbacteria bacterium]|nr:DNA gyrase subunit A [Candidatus Colwellbacteria bacterium]